MSVPVITYNSKTITLTEKPFVHRVTPSVSKHANTTLSGAVETILIPRMDIQVHLEFRTIDSAALRVQIDNFWQWASQGNSWTIALDGSRTVNVVTTSNLAAGISTIPLSSVVGIVAGRTYAMIDGPNYQIVTVSSVGGSSVDIDTGLDAAMGSGTLFRDQFYFPSIIRDDNPPSPIQDIASEAPEFQTWPPTRFKLVLDFYEDVT